MDQTYPHDIEAERQTLGSLLLRPALILPVSSLVSKDDFYLEQHRLIFEGILRLYNEANGTEVDAVRLVQYLTDHSHLEQTGGPQYILDLADSVTSPANAQNHSARIHSLALRRDLIRTMETLHQEATGPQENEVQFLRQVEEKILKITSKSDSRGVVNIQEAKEEFQTYIAKLLESKGGLSGNATGFTEFDNLTHGLEGGQLLVLAARPGLGKSTLAMNMALNMALNEKNPLPILFFSLEMSRVELIARMVCCVAQINHGLLKKGRVPDAQKISLTDAVSRIFKAPIYIDDTGTVDVWDCISRTRKLSLELRQAGKNKPGMVIVDYLQLMTDIDARKQGRQVEVASISRNLKLLSLSESVPILAISQMNRSVEQRRGESAKPQLSDLRESGAIEQDADIVMFIHRDLRPDPDDVEAMKNKGTAEILIEKHRGGPQGSFRLAYRPELFRFDDFQDELS